MVLMWFDIEILIRSFGNTRKMLKIMKIDIFTFFCGISKATMNVQHMFQHIIGNYGILP